MIQSINRNNTTILKGLAILGIVIGHIWGRYTRFYTPVGGIGAALFLILSGYGLQMSYKKNGMKNFWKKRIFTVLIPYIISRILSIPLWWSTTDSLIDILLDFTLIKPRYAYGWYLNHILICYIVFGILQIYIHNNKLKRILACIIAGGFSLYYLFTGNGLHFEQSFTFLIGIVIANNEGNGHFWECFKKITPVLLLSAMIILAIKQLEFIRKFSYLYSISDLFIKSCASCGIIGLASFTPVFQYKHLNSVLSFIGVISFDLYLIHGYAFQIINPIGIGEPIKGCLIIALSALFCFVFRKLVLENMTRIMGRIGK